MKEQKQKGPHGKSVLRSAGLMGIATFLSRILGLVREQVFAFLFGAGIYTDAFIIAFRIPNLLRDLFAEGAMSAALVPTYTEVITKKGDEAGWRLTNLVINSLLLITGVIAVIGMIFSPELIWLYAKDFSRIPEKFALTISMTRMMWPFLPTVALAAVGMAVLNSRGSFFYPALAPVIFNIASIFSGFCICPLMPYIGLHPIFGMAIGVLLGGIGQAVFQMPQMRGGGWRYAPVFDWGDPGLKRILKLMTPGTIGLAATQINIFVNSLLATSQGNGAVSWLNYSFRLMQFPIGIFGVTLSVAMLPLVSKKLALSDVEGAGGTVTDTLKHAIGINIPASVGLSVLSVPIIAVIYEHGRFTPNDTLATASALVFYTAGLISYSCVKILVPVFYVVKRTKIAVITSSLTVAVNVCLCILLVNIIGYRGLALGTSVTTTFQMCVLFYYLKKYVPLKFRELYIYLAKSVSVSGLMGIACYFVNLFTWDLFTAKAALFGRMLSLGLSVGTGLAVFMVFSHMLGMGEIGFIMDKIIRRFRKK